jgi:hypothetical protein
MESCEVCGFLWDSVSADQIPARLHAAAASFNAVLAKAGPLAEIRPESDRWSALEYASHLRDVMISIRERIIAAAILDDPTGTPIYREERVSLGLYADDRAADVAIELEVLANLLAKTVAALPSGSLERTLIYSSLSPDRVTIRWAATQAIHEAEHHRADVEENLELLGG